MIDQQLAEISNLAIVVTIVLYVLALIGFSADLASTSQKRSDERLAAREAHEAARAKQSVTAGAAGATGTAGPAAPTPRPRPRERPRRVRVRTPERPAHGHLPRARAR